MKPNFVGVNTFIRQALKFEVEATRNTNFEKILYSVYSNSCAPHKVWLRFLCLPRKGRLLLTERVTQRQ